MSRPAFRIAKTPIVFLALAFLLGVAGIAGPTSSPPDDLLPVLAASLAERLQQLEVALPDGSQAALVGREGEGVALLSPEQVEICLRTVSAADSWPAAWLVVQEKRRDFDLVMRIALDADGAVATPDFLFTVPRRDWEIADIKPVVRQATGRKPPRQGIGHLVVQGFSTTVVESYVYEPVPTGEAARGLARLLPAGSLIREATAVDLGDGRRYTLALVLHDPVFEPSTCQGCPAELFGHADSGAVTLLLADESEIVDRIDLGPELSGLDGRPLLPRYRCEPDDRGAQPPLAAFENRQPVTLIDLVDLDGDGLKLEVALPAEPMDCDQHLALVVRITPGSPSLDIVDRRPTPTN